MTNFYLAVIFWRKSWVDAKSKFIPLLLLILTVENMSYYPSGVFRVLTRGL